MHACSILSYTTFIGLLIGVARAIALNPVDTTIQPVAGNSTGNEGLQPWPQVPFKVPNGDSASSNGYLQWELLSGWVGIGSRWALFKLIDTIGTLPERSNFPNVLGQIEFPNIEEPHPVFFTLSLRNKEDPRGLVSSANANTILQTIRAQISLHGMKEMQVELIDHPTLEGNMQLVVVDNPRDIPIEVPTFLYVRTNYNNLAIEIFELTDAKTRDPPSDVLQQAKESIKDGGLKEKFSLIYIMQEQWLLFMQASGDQSQDSTPFSNAIAITLIEYLGSYEMARPTNIHFKIWASIRGRTAISIGTGRIIYRADYPSMANSTTSGDMSNKELLNTTSVSTFS